MNVDEGASRSAGGEGEPVDGIAPAGWRLPAATRVGQVRLQVADIERSIAYYRDVLGLRVLQRAGNTAVLGPHGGDVALVELFERAGAAAAPRRGRLGLYHFAILLPDRAALGRFVAHLADSGESAGAADHLVSEALYLQDPDNLGIEVYADRPRETWRHRGLELAMDTLPLDLEDLVRAGAGAPWEGMPAGTVIGHVHLHVGALESAAAFYQHGVGFDRTVWSYPGALFLSAGGYHHHLGLNTWAGPAATAPSETDARLLEWELVLPTARDADAAARNLGAYGYPPARDDDAWLATDPWGTPLRLKAVRTD